MKNKILSVASVCALRVQDALRSDNALLLYKCTGLVALWRIGLEIVNQTIVPLMTLGPATTDPSALRSGAHGFLRWINAWDAAWYSDITRHGYVIVHNFQGYESVAFFPLFPYVVRWLWELTHIPYQIIGLALNLVATSVLAFLVYKLTHLIAKEEKSKNASQLGYLAVILLLLNPSAFFFAAYYADAMLTCLLVGSVYAAYKDKYLLAALLAGLSTAAKSIGVVAMPVLFLIFLARHKGSIIELIRRYWVKIAALAVVSVSGLLVYISFLWVRFGHPLGFIQVEKYWSRDVNGFFLSQIWQIWYAKLLHPLYYRPVSNYAYDVFLMLIPIAVTFFSVYILVKHRLKYAWLAVLGMLTILIPMSTGTLLSLNRYILLLTPALAYVAVYWFDRSQQMRKVIYIGAYFSSVALVVFTLVFLSFRFAG